MAGRTALAALRAGVAYALIGVAAPVAVGAQSYAFSNVVIEGNSRIDASTILARAGITRGEPLTGGELNAAGQELRASGLFESVELVPQGSTLVIRVSEWPTIGRIAFEGNRDLDDEALGEIVSSVERRVFDPAVAEADAASIAEAYAARGRIGAVVEPAIIPRENGQVDLVFQIAEGGVTEVERISFVGNRSFSDRRLRGILETRQAGLLRSIIRADTYAAERVALDRQIITDFYQSRGYADVVVQNADVNLTRERDAFLVTFNVQEGQQFVFGQVNVTSTIPEVSVPTYQSLIRVRPGQTYSPQDIEADVARIEALATQQGISFLRVEPRITRDDRGLALNVEYALVEGDRIFVERIDIEGNATTLDRVIRSQFRTVEGDPLNPRAVRESAERIRALGFFADAEVEAREGSTPDSVVIDVNVTEQNTGSLSFGVNYSSDNGPSLLASLSEKNFLGRGQSLRFELSAGRDNRNFLLDFAEPRFLGRDLRAAVTLSYRSTQRAGALYDTDTFRFAPSLTFPMSENGRLQVAYNIDYTDITNVEGERTDPPEDRASLLIFDEADEGGLWSQSLGYNYSWDTRRTNIDSGRDAVFRFGQEFGFGDTTFIKTTAALIGEARVWGEDVVLRATLEGGNLSYSNGASRVTDRYFLGSRYLRGFARGGIGPRDAATGDALGGETFAVVRLDAEFPIGLPEEYGLTGGAFVDYGSVWSVGDLRSLSDADVRYNDFTPRATAGVSLLWDSPLGPLRMNFMKPIQAEEFDEPQSFDFTVQTSF